MIIKWKVSEDAISSKIEDEVVLMSVDAGAYFGLDPIGSRIWELISQTPLSTNELVDQLLEEYKVEKEQCIKDVEAFINEMTSQQLIQKVNE